MSALEFAWLWGVAGSFGGLTFLFPLTAVFFSRLGRGTAPLSKPPHPIRMEILIPAYNEADTLQRTLESIALAHRRLREKKPDSEIKITVGLDGPKDATPAIAEAFRSRVADGLKLEILNRGFNRGKWATIGELVSQSQGFWSALVDSGTLWPEEFLVRIAERLENSDCVGIAPGYRHGKGGVLSRLIWWQERLLKSLENGAGGPVSLHGATMIFRTLELRDTLIGLGARSWLNDDVVIALMLRTKGCIDYLGNSLCVDDCGVRDGANDLARRKRMLRGNVEWVQELFVPGFSRMWRETPLVALLAFRRIMRMLWAYNLIFSIFCVGMFLGADVSTSVLATALVTGLAATQKRLREPGWVSLTTPGLIFRKNNSVFWA